MSDHSEVLPPPNSPPEFESLCLDLWRDMWGDPNAQLFGRSGQEQHGIDLFGQPAGRRVGLQCKQKSALDFKKLTAAVLTAEVEKAKSFPAPGLDSFILATTARRDKDIQLKALELAKECGFEVTVWSWDDIWHELYQRDALLDRIFAVYWPRIARLAKLPPQKIATSRLPRTSGHLFGREQELEGLEAAWQDKATHILSIVAWGGVGKTSLVAQWVAGLARREFDGADYFDWSFYSQGTRDQTTASADAFVDAALRFFGDEKMADSQQGPWDKGARLAQLVGERKTLLVLDGLEPLQHPPGPMAGELKDPAIQALLRGLALRNAGLCVVTTRAAISDLAPYRQGVVHEWKLDRLSEVASFELLGSLRVQGAKAEIEQLAKDLKGHALTLNLMGRFLRDAHDGDVRKRDLVDLGEASDELENGHAFHVMAAYEGWFAAEGEKGKRQLALLRLLGLFDRPASLECLGALRREPVIAGLTEALVGQKEATWKLTVKQLVETGLVEEVPGGVDAHPLIREYFASRLRAIGHAWQEAHGRLFDFLKDNTEHQPDTLAGLQPLYQAVYHGCQAGRHQEACDAVYRDRILRDTGANGFYSTRKLGAFGADLGAVVCFFESPWSCVSPSLSEADQAWILSVAAFCLHALGRLREAVEPLQAGIQVAARLEDWKNAAIYSNNLSELELTLGEVPAAVADARQSVTFSDRSGEGFLRMLAHTTEADARHQAGEEGPALALFLEAEVLQTDWQHQYPLLYSLAGFRFCDLLLAPAEQEAGCGWDARAPSRIEACTEVEQRAIQTLEWDTPFGRLLDLGLHNLSLGRARLYRLILEGRASEAVAEAQDAIERAVAGLRAAGYQHMLVPGLLTRSWLRFVDGNPEGARADLDEAWEIAERGSMRLHLADVALYRARFFGDVAALAEARRLVAECGYGRRLAEIEELEAQLAFG